MATRYSLFLTSLGTEIFIDHSCFSDLRANRPPTPQYLLAELAGLYQKAPQLLSGTKLWHADQKMKVFGLLGLFFMAR
jgi:hypothetical protein